MPSLPGQFDAVGRAAARERVADNRQGPQAAAHGLGPKLVLAGEIQWHGLAGRQFARPILAVDRQLGA